jgi:Protein of unknown function (DUF1488)
MRRTNIGQGRFTLLSQDKRNNMAITFPNRSRSYDATRRAVRFWGYDRSMENSFFIMADALQRIQPDLRFDTVDILRAFDVNRARIYTIAAKVYARGRKGSYDLNVAAKVYARGRKGSYDLNVDDV